MAGLLKGHRRALLALGGVGAAGVLGLAYLYAHSNQPPPPPSHTQRAQAPSGLPGGSMETEEQARLREQSAQFQAAQAERRNASVTAPMAGQQPFEAGRIQRPPRQVEAEERQRRPQKSEKPGPVDERLASAQAMDLRGLLEGWNGGRMDFQIVLARDAMQPKPEQRTAGGGNAEQRESTASRRKHVLLPGNTGVYGVIKVGANSDVPGAPIVVELRNPGGPVDGLRAGCAYASQSTNRNGGPVAGGIVKCSSLTLADGRNVKIAAVLIGPDDMNTVVATRIDDHFDERILYPMAAGFIRGLGQALLLSGSTIAAGPFGAAQSYGSIGWERAVGVGLGAGAAAAGRVVEQSAPRGPTYFMDGGGQVGVWFQEPVEVED